MSEVPLCLPRIESNMVAMHPRRNLKSFKDLRTKNGSSQGQNLALTVLIVPNSFDSAVSNNPASSIEI